MVAWDVGGVEAEGARWVGGGDVVEGEEFLEVFYESAGFGVEEGA